MSAKMLAATILGFGLIWATGCDSKKDATQKAAEEKKPKEAKEDKHDDHGPGPHKGVIFDCGKWHVEFKPDHAKKEATVWIYGLDQKTPTPIKADKVRLVVSNTTPKIEIDLLPTDKGADGAAHTFTGKHDGFGVEKEYKGTVSFQVDGKPYSEEFSEEPEKKEEKK
ncbi:MAG: hypothetical protein K8U57_08350 [Planctomycetes bacterium]|nr:hypothetical protein [Planctomycetota bacterium]